MAGVATTSPRSPPITLQATSRTTTIFTIAFTRFMAPLAEKMRCAPFAMLSRPGSGTSTSGVAFHPTWTSTTATPVSPVATKNGASTVTTSRRAWASSGHVGSS